MLLRIAHAQILIPEGGEHEARRFYCGLLGLHEIEKPEALRARGGFWLAVGADQQLHVGLERGPWNDRAHSREHVAYEVDDVDAWRARLEAAGVLVKAGEGDAVPGYRRCELRDPFGNRIELMSRLPDAGPPPSPPT
jgi:catechol 2,3-dioxygenase-like lactoylglutathione lyase family enzyme